MDTSQFNSNILSHSDKYFRLAKSILRNDEAARDAVQELSLKLWEKRNELSNVENLLAFSMMSMRNLCFDLLRKNHVDEDLPADFEYNEPNPHQHTEQKDMVTQVKKMIDNLPIMQRTIIRLRDVEAMELTEIALITELTVNAVSVNLSRARQKIRESLLIEQKKVEENKWKI